MKIGPFVVYRQRKTANGLTIHPWHRLTEDRLSPEVKPIVAKMARAVVNDIRDEVREQLLADLTEFYRGLTTALELDTDLEKPTSTGRTYPKLLGTWPTQEEEAE